MLSKHTCKPETAVHTGRNTFWRKFTQAGLVNPPRTLPTAGRDDNPSFANLLSDALGSGGGGDQTILAFLIFALASRFCASPLFERRVGPVVPSLRALSGRLEFTVRRHKFNKYSLSM